jgi:hypothetical protein
MTADELARIVATSLARHQSRGLVDDATGLSDVVIHGRVNLLAVAADVLAAAAGPARPIRESWPGWFGRRVEARRRARRQARLRERLAEQIENGQSATDVALTRLRIRLGSTD